MALNADTLLDRIYLKNQARRWRAIAFALGLIALFVFAERFTDVKSALTGDHIARLTVEDVIYDDIKRHELMAEIAEDDSIKAVILRVNSPGGTTVGSDQIYHDLREIAKHKPVVCTMRTYATSGGYLSAIGADYIIANQGTLTGSIGVIMQTANVTSLIDKLGVKAITVRSGALKGSPSPFEPFTNSERTLIEGVIDDFYQYFLSLVKKRRKLTDEQTAVVADGRVVSAGEALKLGLIDAIGDEKEALEWLAKEHKIDAEMEIIEAKPKEDSPPLDGFFENIASRTISGFFKENALVKLDGLVSIWQPALLH